MRVHESVNSFVIDKTIIDNAKKHKRQPYVGTIDIENFFGSITEKMVTKALFENNYNYSEADFLAKLCTFEGVLPQGAPTSPILSNALLYSFDDFMHNLCEEFNLIYSRYADDITISGKSRENVKNLQQVAEELLAELYKLSINKDKTRIISYHNRQVVTGLVVNEKIHPPRDKRRKIRAAFHNASAQDIISKEEFNRLKGYLSYLNSIPNLKETPSLKKYKDILTKLKKRQTNRPSLPPTPQS